MSNILNFSSFYRSIKQLDETNLPNFVVLTGLNGSGKSHLLNAILNGNVTSSLVNNLDSDVRLFDSNTIIPSDTDVHNPAQHQAQRSGWFSIIEKQREANFQNLQQCAIQLGVPYEFCSDISMINELDIYKLSQILPNPENAEQVELSLKQQIKQQGANVANYSSTKSVTKSGAKRFLKFRQIPQSYLCYLVNQIFFKFAISYGVK